MIIIVRTQSQHNISSYVGRFFGAYRKSLTHPGRVGHPPVKADSGYLDYTSSTSKHTAKKWLWD
jgi:hypothetical protein